MQVALTGVSGFIGSAIARHLHGAGHSVIGLVRPGSRRDHLEPWVARLEVGDQADPGARARLLEGADSIVHNSFDWEPLRRDPPDLRAHLLSNLMGAIEFLEAGGGRPFVYMSSVAVHHAISDRWQGLIDEDHPLRPASAYGACKAAVEAHLWAAHHGRGWHCCALRPAAVYGIDPRRERSIGWTILDAVLAGRPYTRPGGGKFVHVDDVAAATVAALSNPAAAGRAIDLADCYARWSDLARMACELAGVEVEVDESSPPAPRNQFSKDAARELGVRLDRGHEGIREHLRELLETRAPRGRSPAPAPRPC